MDEGPKDERLLTLSQLSSRAVDTQKHGLAVELQEFEGIKELKDKTPHFMEKEPRNTRTSNKILGKLYDQVSLD